MTYWRVIILLNEEQAIHCRFPNKVSATVMYRLCKEELENEKIIGIHLVRCKAVLPDEKDRGEEGKYWCPYCGAWRTFWKRNDYHRCEICWVSNSDFYWQLANHWRYKQDSRKRVVDSPDAELKRRRRRERRQMKKGMR